MPVTQQIRAAAASGHTPRISYRTCLVIERPETHQPPLVLVEPARVENGRKCMKMPQIPRERDDLEPLGSVYEALAKLPYTLQPNEVEIVNRSKVVVVEIPASAREYAKADEIHVIFVHVRLNEGVTCLMNSDLHNWYMVQQVLISCQTYRYEDYETIFNLFDLL